jgi:O-antigen ligase
VSFALPSRNHVAALLVRVAAVGSVLAYMSAVRMLGPDAFVYPKEWLLHACAFAMLALTFWRRPTASLGRADALLALFLVLGVASAVVAAENGWQALRVASLATSAAAVYWSSRQLATDGYRTHLLTSVALAAVLAAATALLEAHGALGHLSLENRGPGGTLGNRNRMAHVLALALPLTLPLLSAARRRVAEWAVYAGVTAVVAALVLSRCRAGWLAAGGTVVLCVAWLVLARLSRRQRAERAPLLAPRHAAALALAGVAGVALAVLPPNALHWRSQSPYLDTLRRLAEYDAGSGEGRVVMYANTLGMVRDHPLLGVGPGNWSVQYPRYATPGDPSA